MKNIRILLADDHESVRQGYKKILEEEENFTVVGEVRNGIQAIDFIKENSIDIALLDLSMPEMDGIVATKNIKQIAPNIKVILLTMHNGQHYIRDAIQAGIDAYILKLSNFDLVKNAIRSIMSGEKYFDDALTIGEKSNFSKYLAPKGITEREEEVIILIVQGFTSRQIGKKLQISPNTVSNHRKNILRKLNLKNTAELIHLAIMEGIIVK